MCTRKKLMSRYSVLSRAHEPNQILMKLITKQRKPMI